MVISFCIPVHNRTYDLKQTMPYLIRATETYPPVEVVILDYNSPDDLGEYVKTVKSDSLTYRKYTGRDYYHMAHARNLSVMASSGEYIVTMSADIYPMEEFIPTVRAMIHGYTWMYDPIYTGVIVCQRQEFIEAGGYDERFEFYGPEDNDLHDRLARRGKSFGILPSGLIKVIETANEDKIKNYRLPLSKREMHQRMKAIYNENNQVKSLVANEGQAWGEF